jgi:gliding motility-associated-like protein
VIELQISKNNLSRWIQVLLIFSAAMLHHCVFAQPGNDNCATATSLCANSATQANNIGATAELGAGLADGPTNTGTFCFDVNNSVWFSFTTNSSGGAANVSISNISCLAGGGFDQDLQAVMIDAAVPCDASTYTSVSNCEMGSAGNIGLIAGALAPNTTYYVIVDGDSTGVGITEFSQCDFSIEVSGPAVDVEITATVVDQTCPNIDGEITITTIDGAPAPYQYSLNGGAFQGSSTFTGLTAGSYSVTVQDANGCEHVLTPIVVPLAGGPTSATAAPTDATDCNQPDGSILVNAVVGGNPPYTYSINGGAPQASSTFLNLTPGTYDITVFDAQGCPYQLEAVEVDDATDPWDVTTVATTANCGQTDGTIGSTANAGGTPPYTYSLNGGAGQANGAFPDLAPGIYTITITDANGCVYTVNNIIVEEVPASLTPGIVVAVAPNPTCLGDPTTATVTGTDVGNTPNYEFFVNGASVQSGVATTYSGVVNNGDVINVIMTSNDPCLTSPTATSNNVTVTVFPPSSPTVTITTATISVCQNDIVNFDAIPVDCNGTATFDWMIDGVVVSSGPLSSFETSALSNNAQVSVQMNCDDPCANPNTSTSNVITMDVTEPIAFAGPDGEIIAGESYNISGGGSGTFLWTPASTLDNALVSSPVATPGTSTTYILAVTDGNCIAYDEVTVVVLESVLPYNTFTPNGDGINDEWVILRIENFPDARVLVYTRWGQKVFNSSGYSTPWDGTNRGLSLAAATYYYVIELDPRNSDVGQVTGSITLIR